MNTRKGEVKTGRAGEWEERGENSRIERKGGRR